MVHNATKGRTKSVQFEKSMVSLDTTDRSSSRDGASSPPVPGSRTSSLPVSENRDSVNTMATIRHYRSMLDIEEPPRLPIAKPMSYDELYPKPSDPIPVHKIPLRRPLIDSQGP
ncbi:hypothetical protein QBC42DRAFT_173058 [Cladorrhinum samala]|uniref:Uncharacterized protein n=1 Tax=Cladorrhinum samala TaxID=585594 RepID=A0AAV9HW53_9PEZI|nr:hypothetical protein QBC42DRAFT_173058 [Cladorrhinum samala]